MSTPYQKTVTVSKPGAGAVVVEIPFPTRTFLHRVLTRQEGGSSGYAVDLFDSDPTGFATANPEEIHLLCSQITGASGKSATFFNPPVPFLNVDTAESDGTRPRKIYARVSGAGTGTFHITVAGASDIIG